MPRPRLDVPAHGTRRRYGLTAPTLTGGSMRRLVAVALAATLAVPAVPAAAQTSSATEVRSNAIAFALTSTQSRSAVTLSTASCSGAAVLAELKKARGMAKAWRLSPAGPVKTDLAARIGSGLRAIHSTCWNRSKPASNWYDNEIAFPEEVASTALLMHGSGVDLAPLLDTSLHFASSRIDSHTGANVTGVGLVTVLIGAVRADGALLTRGRTAMLKGLAVSRWEGFTPDGGYAYHNALYTAGYGAVLARRFAAALNVFGRTTWQFTADQTGFLFDRLLDGFRPTTAGQAFMELARGRQVTAQYGSAPASGIAQALGWMRPWAGNRTADLDAWAAQLSGRAHVRPETFRMFWDNDKAVWHNGEVAVGVSMHSERRRAFETLQGNNLEGWYLSESMVELHDSDANQFSDWWLATIDRQRLPGATVSRKPLRQLPCSPDTNGAAWVGGAMLGTFGTAGQQLDPNLRTPARSTSRPTCAVAPVDLAVDLEAKRSWFFFDDEVVALGTDIRSNDPTWGVETVVENRKVNGADVITIDGARVSPPLGTTTEVRARWAHLAGDRGSQIGWWFPAETTLDVLREQRTGAWSQIDRSSFSPTPNKSTPVTRKFVSLAVDHGVRPDGATVAWVLLPATTADGTAAYAANPDVTILANSPTVQAAADRSSGVTAANFWSAGSVGGITASAAASVVTRTVDGQVHVAVSDPTQRRTGTLRLSLGPVGSVVSTDPNITVVATSPRLVLDVAPAVHRGSTSTAVFVAAPVCICLPGTS